MTRPLPDARRLRLIRIALTEPADRCPLRRPDHPCVDPATCPRADLTTTIR